MNDQDFLILFRLLHVGCSIFWAGSVLYLAFFVLPALNRSGPEGTKFMQQLVKTRYPAIITISAFISIVAGILLLWKLSNHFERIWFTTLYARILSVGMATGIIAFLVGITVSRTSAVRLAKISGVIATAGNTATTEQLQELTRLKRRISTTTVFIAILLIITIISMSIFRYVS